MRSKRNRSKPARRCRLWSPRRRLVSPNISAWSCPMHEASLMADLMREITMLAKRGGGRRIVRVSVAIGPLSHFSADHLTEHFRREAAGTAAEGASLDIAQSDDLGDPAA